MIGATMEIDGSRLKELRQAAEKCPDSALAHLRLGTALVRLGMIKKAEEAFRRAVELDPGHAESWSNLGGALLARWDAAGCIDANHRALQCNPHLVQAHYNLGLGYLYLGDAQQMLVWFRRVVELDPDHAGGHYHLAVALHADGQIDRARASLARAVALGYTPEPDLLRALESHGGTTGPAPVVELGPEPEDSTK